MKKNINSIKQISLFLILFFSIIISSILIVQNNSNNNNLNKNAIENNQKYDSNTNNKLIDNPNKSVNPNWDTIYGGRMVYGLFSIQDSSFYFHENGSIYVWGRNNMSVLGIGSNVNRREIFKADDLWGFDANDITHFYSDGWSSYVFLTNNEIWAWGKNEHGQLSIGNLFPDDIVSPTRVDFSWEFTAADIDKFYLNGYKGVFVFLNNGEIWVFGYNVNGQLGINNTADQPWRVQADPIWGFDANQIVEFLPTQTTIYAALNDDSIYGWGNNQYGQLGISTLNDELTPQLLSASWGFDYGDINKMYVIYWPFSNIDKHVFVLLNNMQIMGFGSNDNNVFGLVETHPWIIDGKITTPRNLKDEWHLVFNTNNINELYFDSHVSMAFLNDGTTYGWGNNLSGQLGIGDNKTRIYVPILINENWTFNTNDISDIYMYYQTTIIFLNDYSIYVIGKNDFGQLGIENTNDAIIPIKVDNYYWDFNGNDIDNFWMNNRYIFTTLKDGSVYAWGRNDYGQLGFDKGGIYETTLLIQLDNFNYDWDINDNSVNISFNYNKAWWGSDDLYYSFYDEAGNLLVNPTKINNLSNDGTKVNNIIISNLSGITSNDYYEIWLTSESDAGGLLINRQIDVNSSVSSVNYTYIDRTSVILEFYYIQGYTGDGLIEYNRDDNSGWILLPNTYSNGLNSFTINDLSSNINQYTITVAPEANRTNSSQSQVFFNKPTTNDSIISNLAVQNVGSDFVVIDFNYDSGLNSTGYIEYSLNNQPYSIFLDFFPNGNNTFTIQDLNPSTNYQLKITPQNESLTMYGLINFSTLEVSEDLGNINNNDSDSSNDSNLQSSPIELSLFILIMSVALLSIIAFIVYFRRKIK